MPLRLAKHAWSSSRRNSITWPLRYENGALPLCYGVKKFKSFNACIRFSTCLVLRFFIPVSINFSGKTPSLFRHDLAGLHSKQSDRLTISMNAMHKIPSKFVPKKFTMTQKVANTKGCSKCCVGRNPYNGYKYLCGSTPQGIFLMQWYDPLNKFMLLKVSFELIISKINFSVR